MVKLFTIGMLKTAKNDPTVIADVTDGTINGYLHTIGSDGKADAPVAGDATTAQSIDLRIALNDITGDNTYKDGVLIAKGQPLNSYLLKSWDGQDLIVNEENITYATDTDYTDITAGTTIMVAHTDGKFIIADGTTLKAAEHKINFAVAEKLQYNGNAVRVKISAAY